MTGGLGTVSVLACGRTQAGGLQSVSLSGKSRGKMMGVVLGGGGVKADHTRGVCHIVWR